MDGIAGACEANPDVIPLCTFSSDEVAKHNAKNDCWVIIHGLIYDVTEFLPTHPGKEALLWFGGGRDASIQFELSHPPRVNADNYLFGNHAKVRVVGKLDQPQKHKGVCINDIYDWDSPCWVEMKRKCWDVLYNLVQTRPGYEPGKFAAVTYNDRFEAFDRFASYVVCGVLMAGAFLSPLVMESRCDFYNSQLFWARCAIAFCASTVAARLGFLMHDDKHRGLDNAVTDWFGLFDAHKYSMDHMMHHSFTNYPDFEVEEEFVIQACKGMMRLFDWQTWRFAHWFQWLYWPVVVFVWMPLHTRITDMYYGIVSRRSALLHYGPYNALHYLRWFWAFFMVLFIIIPLPVEAGRWTSDGCGTDVRYVSQFVVFLIFLKGVGFWGGLGNVLQHLVADENADRTLYDKVINGETTRVDFAKVTLSNTQSFSAESIFLTWFWGGVNTQVEHHLFPTVPFNFLPYLTPVICEVAKKHGVEHVNPNQSILSLVWKFQKRMWELSARPTPKTKGGVRFSLIINEINSEPDPLLRK